MKLPEAEIFWMWDNKKKVFEVIGAQGLWNKKRWEASN